MARVVYSANALDDLDRLTDFLLDSALADAAPTVELIIEAVNTLENHPQIGRPAESDLFELIISRGETGYSALYSLEENDEVVLILAIRHQRESGYTSTRG